MGEPKKTMAISGWGRFPVQECSIYRPERRRAVSEILAARDSQTLLARGLGRSYGDASTNGGGGLVLFERLDRILDFNDETGLLRCEAGISLATIIDVFLPRGYFLPVTPGTKFVTVGGAIAHDVHGKNHHCDGTFGDAVSSLELLLPSGEIVVCSREEHAEVFWATLGGIGLTGFILTATIQLQPVESAYCVVDYIKCPNLDAALASLDETENAYQYSVAWVDCLSRGASLGRSVLMLGNHAAASDLTPRQPEPFSMAHRSEWSIPFDFPGFALNTWSVKAFNAIFNAMHKTVEGTIAHFDPYFYPLDRIRNWNRMYGRRGFVQYQVTVPLNEQAGLARILEATAASGRASFLGVLKKFGPANDGLLSYPFAGYTLTLDIPVRDGLSEFLHKLDAILLDHGGRLYTAKDAVMTKEAFRAMYPRMDEFLDIRQRLDPDGILSSSLARRVGLATSEGTP